MNNSISSEQLKDVCKIGQGADCCRYIGGGESGLECQKHTDLKGLLDSRVKAGLFVAIGDNCEGLK